MRRFRLRRPSTPSINAALEQAHEADGLWSFPPDQARLIDERQGAPSPRRNGPTVPITHLVVDARCLQHPDFATRGIGRYTTSLLRRLADEGQRLTLLTDSTLPDLNAASLVPHEALSDPVNIIWDASTGFLDPAPMTHPPSRADASEPALRIAVVYDFIPAHAPQIYLASPAAIDEYSARLRRLETFDVLWPISRSVADDGESYVDGAAPLPLPLPPPTATRDPTPVSGVQPPFIFAALGADRRKNLLAAVCAVAGLDDRTFTGQLVILSHMPDAHRIELNELAETVGLDHRRIVAVADLSDAQVQWLYKNAQLVLMPSFDEGLSLPIIEALDSGCPVVASDIPPHRELLGPDTPLCDPRSAQAFADQAKRVLSDRANVLAAQQHALATRRASDTDAWLSALGANS